MGRKSTIINLSTEEREYHETQIRGLYHTGSSSKPCLYPAL